MLAPEIIGEKRLLVLEEIIEQKSRPYLNFVFVLRKDLNMIIQTRILGVYFTLTLYFITSSAFLFVSIGTLLGKLSLYPTHPTVIIAIFLVISLLISGLIAYTSNTKLLYKIFIVLFSPLFLSLLIIVLNAFIIFYLVVVFFGNILRSFIDILQGSEKLKGIIVYWGIILFVIGNALQLLSTVGLQKIYVAPTEVFFKFTETFDRPLEREWLSILPYYSIVDGKILFNSYQRGSIGYYHGFSNYLVSMEITGSNIEIFLDTLYDKSGTLVKGYAFTCLPNECYWRDIKRVLPISREKFSIQDPFILTIDARENKFFVIVNGAEIGSFDRLVNHLGGIELSGSHNTRVDNFVFQVRP